MFSDEFRVENETFMVQQETARDRYGAATDWRISEVTALPIIRHLPLLFYEINHYSPRHFYKFLECNGLTQFFQR